MAERDWIFKSNTFEVQTRKSNVKMLSLSTDTHAKLSAGQADPEILILFNLFDPIFSAYRQICIDYDVMAGNRKGGTLAFQNILDQIPTELRKWEGPIRAIHFEDSPEERAIFPNKRSPFLKGTYEERIGAIGTLAQKLSGMPALATTHAQVQSFYNMALGTRLAQQQGEGSLAQMSDLRERQRIMVANMLYGVLGYLMFKYRDARDRIDNYFDLTLLRPKGEGAQATNLAGLVTNALNSAPLVGVSVTIIRSGGTLAATTTDASGSYAFPDLDITEATDVQVRFSLAGFEDAVLDLTLMPGEDNRLDAGMS
jgi:hypothetical protein